jgi:flagellar protein FliO/FliZ
MGTTTSGIDWFRFTGSMAVVVVLLVGLVWTLRKIKLMQNHQSAARTLQIIETISMGPRQKIALIRAGNKQILIGMTATQFTALGAWDTESSQQESSFEA